MASFSLPPINDNPDGGWGPSSSATALQFKFQDIPYAPYSKSDKLGRVADWNDLSGDGRQAATGLPSTTGGPRGGPRGRKEQQAFGSGTANAFAYFHVDDEASFSLVDNKPASARRGAGYSRGRGGTRGGLSNRGGAQRSTRGLASTGRGGGRGGGARRGGWRDWEKVLFIEVA
jgi:translation initiation factor 3 subunit D